MEEEGVRRRPVRRLSAFNRPRIQRWVTQDARSEESSVCNEDIDDRIPEKDVEDTILKENCSSITKQQRIINRVPFQEIRAENNSLNSMEGVGDLGTQAALKQLATKSNPTVRKSYHRRSCAPRFMKTESSSPWGASVTTNGDYKSEKNTTLYSSAMKLSKYDDSENVCKESLIPDFKSRFASRLNRSLRQKKDSESRDKKENDHARIPADKEKGSDLITSHCTTSRLEMDYQEKSASEKKSERKSCFSGGRRKRLSAVRRSSIFDPARQRPQTSALSSVEKTTASGENHEASLGQRFGNSVRRSRLSHRIPHSSLRRVDQQKDLPVMGIAGENKMQECRRILEFESGDEGENNEDQTAPLSMMVQTPIMTRASVLQNPVEQKQQKEVCEPVIKRGLLDECVKTSRFRRRWSTHISQQPKNNASLLAQNVELKVSRFVPHISKESDNSSEALFGHGTKPKNTHPTSLPTQEDSTSNSTSLSTKKISNFPAHPASTKRIQRRRSAAVLCVRTPRKYVGLEAKTTSKLIGSSVLSKTPGAKGSQKSIKSRRSFVVTRRLSSQPQTIDEVAKSNTEDLEYTKNTVEDNVANCKPHKVDASTNTTINFAKIKHVDLKLIEDIENLFKEQAVLNEQAVLMQEKTTARPVEMKEKRLMESFLASLRRLKAIFSENHEDESAVQGSSEYKKVEGEDDGSVSAQEAHGSSDQSEVQWKSPEALLDIMDHQIQWRRRQNDNRLIRTFQEVPIEEEEFSESCQENTSPFTCLVGDCERPSLAPMTPHSRRNVALLKLSLRDQLEQLYEN